MYEEDELEDVELEEEETGEENVESVQETKKAKTQKLELDFELDPVERLTKEIDFTDDPNQKAIGNFLLEEFKKDEVIKADYKAKKITLDKILAFVKNEARNRVSAKTGTQCVMMSDQEVYGLVIHYIHDGAPKESKETKCILTKEEKKSLEEQAREEYLAEQKAKIAEAERKKAEKEKAARERALEKEKKEREELGQMSLFDMTYDED